MQVLSAILVLCFCLAGGGIMDSLGPGLFLFWGVVILGGAALLAADSYKFRRRKKP